MFATCIFICVVNELKNVECDKKNILIYALISLQKRKRKGGVEVLYDLNPVSQLERE